MSNSFLAVLCLTTMALNTQSAPVVAHSVTGSAVEQQEIAPFGFPVTISVRVTVAAFQGADGSVWGELISNIDLRPLGLGWVTFTAAVDCLHVVGNQAWIGSSVMTTTNPDIFPIGDTGITYIQDLGGNGQDLMFGVESDASCSDAPDLPGLRVMSGNYIVR